MCRLYMGLYDEIFDYPRFTIYYNRPNMSCLNQGIAQTLERPNMLCLNPRNCPNPRTTKHVVSKPKELPKP